MLTQLVWWTANALIGLLLFRSIKGNLYSKYPVFYIYLSYVLLESLIRFVAYTITPSFYSIVYWNTEFLSIIVGYCVIWEINVRVFSGYAGAGRMARTVLLAALVMVLARYLAVAFFGEAGDRPENLAVLERDLRTVQAFLLAGIVVVLGYYRIPLGRNLLGMILGYGLYIGAVVVNLAIQSYLWATSGVWWESAQPIAYVVSLGVWCATLWSYQPNPQFVREVRLETDYQLMAGYTTQALVRARNSLVRAVRP